MMEILEEISAQQNWRIVKSTPVHGGDINQSFCIATNQDHFFVKLNDAKTYPKMFELEAVGLNALRRCFSLKVPEVIAVGVASNQQYLILEWLQPTANTNESWQAFGRALAALHRHTNETFGWHTETYIASIIQTNKWCDSWPEFYSQQRIMPLVKQLFESHSLTVKDVQQAEMFCNRFVDMIPDEQPALLHGDLWSGNVMAVLANQQTTMAIYDPDVFFGHREIDIAMTRLFGGFPSVFYDAYEEVYPLQKGWQQRLSLFQLYPLLVHAVLFGGGYIGRVKQIIDNG